MLGDAVAEALAAVGVTEGRASLWLGKCGCSERREKLNQLDRWARRVLSGKVAKALFFLETILGPEPRV